MVLEERLGLDCYGMWLVKVPMQNVDLGKQDALITHPSLPSDARENWPAGIVVVFVSFAIMRIQSKSYSWSLAVGK